MLSYAHLPCFWSSLSLRLPVPGGYHQSPLALTVLPSPLFPAAASSRSLLHMQGLGYMVPTSASGVWNGASSFSEAHDSPSVLEAEMLVKLHVQVQWLPHAHKYTCSR